MPRAWAGEGKQGQGSALDPAGGRAPCTLDHYSAVGGRGPSRCFNRPAGPLPPKADHLMDEVQGLGPWRGQGAEPLAFLSLHAADARGVA